jgi:hypothetical protein
VISPEETFARVWRFTVARIMRTDWTACEAPKRKRPCRIQIARSAPHQSRIGARWSRVLIHCGLARFPALLQWCTHQTPLSKLELLAGSLFSQTLRAWWGRVNRPNVTRTPPTSSSVPVRPQSEQRRHIEHRNRCSPRLPKGVWFRLRKIEGDRHDRSRRSAVPSSGRWHIVALSMTVMPLPRLDDDLTS